MIKRFNFKNNGIFIYGGLIFAYCLLRSIWTPIYYDEILNYFLFVEPGNFQPFYAAPDANNHLISTSLSHVIYLLFGNKLLLMRIPSVLSFILFFFYLWKFRSFFNSKLIGNCFLITFCSSFYVISFFSLSRGYGISMAFLLGTVFHLIQFYETSKIKSVFWATLMGSLAIWSNLSLIFIVCTVLSLLMVRLVYFLKNKEYKTVIFGLSYVLIIGTTPLLIAVKYSFYLKENGALYMGNSDGFWDAVILDIPGHLFSSHVIGHRLFIGWIALLLIGLILNLKHLRLTKKLVIAISLVLGTFSCSIALHLLFDVNYPRERAALHFFIVVVIAFFILIDQLPKHWKKIGLYPPLIFFIHLLVTVNFSYTPVFKFETLNDEHYKEVVRVQKKHDHLLTISAMGILGRVLDHYNYVNQSNINTFQESDYPSKIADLMLVNTLTAPFDVNEFDTLYYNSASTVALLERKNKAKWITKITEKAVVVDSNKEYINLFDFYYTPTAGSSLKMEIEMDLLSELDPCDSWLVCDLTNNEHKNRYESIYLQRAVNDYSKKTHLRRAFYLTDLPHSLCRISCYIWNISKGQWKISNANCSLYETSFPF